MSPVRRDPPSRPFRFPRVSGDEPSYTVSSAYFFVFSPRERG